jgi:PPP family 3-phenylpropionic acid transporter
LGVIAEIVLFALSPRFTLQPSMLVVIAALSAAARWAIMAQDPPLAVLAVVQLAHALSFGLTQVGIMGLMLRQVPSHMMARGQGYLTACGGIVAGLASVASGTIYENWGQGIYYVMAVMAALGGLVVWLARERLSHQPHKAASGG